MVGHELMSNLLHNMCMVTVVIIVWSICRLQPSVTQLEEKLAQRSELLIRRASAGLALVMIFFGFSPIDKNLILVIRP
jgi:hypothetical protein